MTNSSKGWLLKSTNSFLHGNCPLQSWGETKTRPRHKIDPELGNTVAGRTGGKRVKSQVDKHKFGERVERSIEVHWGNERHYFQNTENTEDCKFALNGLSLNSRQKEIQIDSQSSPLSLDPHKVSISRHSRNLAGSCIRTCWRPLVRTTTPTYLTLLNVL